MLITFPKHGAVYAKKLATDLLEQGFSERQVFGKSGLTAKSLQPEKPMLEVQLITAFFENAAALTGNDTLGFMRGQKREMRRSGLVAYIGISSPTVLSYMLNMAHYRRVFTDAIEVDCDALEHDGILKWHYNVPANVRRRQLVEFGSSGLVHAMRQASGVRFSPELVTYSHARNSNMGEFERYFGCKVEFGAPGNAIHFHKADLALPLQTADNELYAILKGCCEQALEGKSRKVAPLIVDVETAISDRLNRGEANQENVARALGMSPRTLSRRLAREGTTFFKSLENLRKTLARSYLRDSDLGLAEISFLLGYSGLSSFNDAFKRWTGKTPGQYRIA